ncbi:hypothetical protein SCA6_018422 [Theobroma cacao]
MKNKPKAKLAVIIATPIALFFGLLAAIYCIHRRRRKLEDEAEERDEMDQMNQDQSEDMDLAVFELATIARATDNFCFDNKLGEGGFGPGTLANGQEIAVKRLSKSSGQGLNEFKTEVKLIAKLQHRNLVRLLGGYMAPEYAIDGLFSVKSDVFSFGILLLEIISGRKNRGFYHQNQSGNLIEHEEVETYRIVVVSVTIDEEFQGQWTQSLALKPEELKNKAKVKLAVIIATPIAMFLGLLVVIYYIRRRRRKLEDEVKERILNDQRNQGQSEDMELAVFELGTIARATGSFSFNNKLGEGGFGPVYKGTLANGQEIAVKRLSKSSGQGLNEFKTEVKLIAKLQHRNLVRLLGCCIHGEEKMLVYEYMPNRSLDSFIFGQKPFNFILSALGL